MSGAARQIDDIVDALEADARQRRDGLGGKPQRGERQRRQQCALLAAGIARRLAEMRGGPGGADVAGDGDGVGKARLRDALAQIGDQRFLAAVKMRAAADVEQQAVGRVDRHQRRVAQAPVGDILQQGCVGLGVFLDRLQRRMHGARLRQREAGVQAEPFRRLVDGDDQLGIAALAVDDECSHLSPRAGRGRLPGRSAFTRARRAWRRQADEGASPRLCGLLEADRLTSDPLPVNGEREKNHATWRCGRSRAGAATG